ncbi:MAG: HPr(Ser) kinase/phosphatase [Oscillospiraceae bacterium]|nr:HPr(Ser) kinase/phosphatase [Oscillospiraceae bacterium]MBP3521650.1 HPr(Ser) kinase/phosphatase [Oscillospiraceae bacterium]
MESQRSIKLSQVVEQYHLEILRKGSNYDKCEITTEDVSRPGLQLSGYIDYFDADRIQIIGKIEYTYLAGMSWDERVAAFGKLFSLDIPALIISRGMEPFPECMQMAERYDRTILRTQEKTTAIQGALFAGLRDSLAPRITRHGVLMEIYGEGVFITGESGVGKSETAIELIKRGHRLIADDAVEITRTGGNHLMGTAPELIRYYMELRGIGVVDVRRLFGMSAIKDSSPIDLVLHLELWKEGAFYDRLGAEEQTTKLLDVELPSVTIPVRPGRNLAVIVEVAAMNNRHKKMGYNAAQELIERQNRYFEEALAAQEQ